MEPTIYIVEIGDTNGKAIVPGYFGARYESQTPLPIPRVGDSLVSSLDRKFLVESVTYQYLHNDEPPHQLISMVQIVCRPNQE
jgi:hypothetical protein